jgi:YidC/Oxa1 family membrane protein insertase
MWEGFVDLVRATIFAGTHLFNGSLGASIFGVSALVRLVILPLTLRAARLAQRQQAALARLKPQLDRLQSRYKSDPVRLMTETQALQRANGIRMMPRESVVSALIQLPLLGGLFAAVREGLGTKIRFLWIADLTRGDILLTSIVVALTGVASSIAPATPGSPNASRVMAFVIMGLTLMFLWSSSSAVAISVGAGSAVSALQNWILRRWPAIPDSPSSAAARSRGRGSTRRT